MRAIHKVSAGVRSMSGIVYQEVFWIFMAGNILGVIVEGLWCLFRYGKWQTHVVTIWGPFNIVYGIGMAMFFVVDEMFYMKPLGWRIASLAIVGSLVEYLCGLTIRIGLNMKAWDYRNHFLNIQGLISLKMALVWGTLGAIFDKFLYKPLKEALSYVEGSVWDAICAAGSAFMIVNLTYTSLCIIRWANRHKNKPPLNRISRFIDRRYPNHWMEKKFCNWRFIDNEI
jgi:uncharacterized membrane protein